MKTRSLINYIVLTVLTAIFCFNISPTNSFGQQSEEDILRQIQWETGPTMGSLGEIAEISVPEGYLFAGANDTRLIMEVMQNPTSGYELGFIGPEGGDWFVIFEFNDIGYVKDDEKDSLDADAILKAIKVATEKSNEERKRRGWPIMTVIGWEQPPRYNLTTHNLEWAIRGESEGVPIINHNTRLLGRKGVMRVTLVVEPTDYFAVMPQSKTLIDGFRYKQGHKYAEFIQGDKVAKYGLTALITGGAAAVAVKSGLFKWLWKIIVVAFMAVIGFFRKLFSRKTKQR